MLVLGLLTLVNALNFMDRLLFSILQEPIKHDLGLTDFQLGLLGGPGFAILYSLMALPIGRLADRANRVRIIATVTILWSSMTAACGAAASFMQLLLPRFGVSVGEAGCAPAAHSLIADYFPPARRTSAIAVFTSGASIGTLAAAFVGSALAGAYGWRVAFYACGAAGMVTVVIVLLLVRETPRSTLPAGHAKSLWGAARILAARRSFVHVSAGMALATLSNFAITQYLTSFLVRVHHLPLGSAAGITGLLKGGVAFFVMIATGLVIDRFRGRHPAIGTVLPAVGLTIGAVAFTIGFSVGTLSLAVAALVIGVAGTQGYLAAGFAAAQDLAPPRLRSTAAGLMMLLVGLVGYAIGSPLVGLVSDTVAGHALAGSGFTVAQCARLGNLRCQSAAADGIRWGMLAVVAPLLWAALHFALAGRNFHADGEGGT